MKRSQAALFLTVLLASVLLPPAASAMQLGEPPNDFGVKLGHVRLTVKSVRDQVRFWTEMMGGTLLTNAPVTMIEFPGIYVVLQEGQGAAPTNSVLEHFGFVLKDINAARARWKAANITYTIGDINPNQGYVDAPDGVRVEVFGDPSMPGPIGMDHIHTYVVQDDIASITDWYAKVLGGLPGTRKRVAGPGVINCVYFHRFNVSFSPTPSRRTPAKGHSLEGIGFDVKNLDEFAERVGKLGIQFDSTPQRIPNSQARIGYLTDPWGLRIEVTEKLLPGGR
jgi:catechol 2,3-dioxygenase-like lactoylglutathione lyase family enzyme